MAQNRSEIPAATLWLAPDNMMRRPPVNSVKVISISLVSMHAGWR